LNGRSIAIGDIHGCDVALRALLDAIAVQPADKLILLGDYVDRGSESEQVIDRLLELGTRCRMIPLLGNHEEMMLAARHSPYRREFWLHFGGDKTLASYGPKATLAHVPAGHWSFIERCHLIHVTERHFFTHASYDPQQPLNAQPTQLLLWQSLRDAVPAAHASGKIAVVGHTPQGSGDVLDMNYLKCIDTGCVYGGYLTALDVDSGEMWQVDQHGRHRSDRQGLEATGDAN
jgi:serine/threonine protein phosphatase 1